MIGFRAVISPLLLRDYSLREVSGASLCSETSFLFPFFGENKAILLCSLLVELVEDTEKSFVEWKFLRMTGFANAGAGV